MSTQSDSQNPSSSAGGGLSKPEDIAQSFSSSIELVALNVLPNMGYKESAEIRALYNNPVDLELIIPGPHQTADKPLLECIAIHALLMESGLRLPFYHFFRKILSEYRLAPT
ncbi:hypothetical protein Adt_21352 [Abeliophyllum distichum]|uniref:Uncharacterized protein n=1 Tax=Abeliophyllum distichum TaxID=126358 RepID=A0ABD1SZ40_9LAMI